MCPPLQHVARNVAEVESLRATNYVVLARTSQLRAISFMGGHAATKLPAMLRAMLHRVSGP